MKKGVLNTRQWDLYLFLKSKYSENRYISKLEICTALPMHYKYGADDEHKCRMIEADVRIINSQEEIQKIIVTNKTGYKIGTKAEVTEYLNRRFRKAGKAMKLNWLLANKVGLNGQMRLTFGNERDVIEAYMK